MLHLYSLIWYRNVRCTDIVRVIGCFCSCWRYKYYTATILSLYEVMTGSYMCGHDVDAITFTEILFC